MQSDAEYFGLKRRKPTQDGYDSDQMAEQPVEPMATDAKPKTQAGFEQNWAGGMDPVGAGGNNSMTKPDGAFTNQNTPVSSPSVPVGGSAPVHATPSATYNPNAGATNKYGGTASLDPTAMRQQTIDLWQKRFGGMPSEAQIAEVIKYASRPDKFSDEQVRVGVNPYWIERIGTGLESADPSLAGSEGILSNYAGALPESGFNADHGFGSGARGAQIGTGGAGASGASAMDQTVNDYILKLLSGEATANVGKNIESDPAVAAYSRASDRRYAKLRAQAAESAAQGGTIGSGGFEGMIRNLKEDQASDVASYAGDRVVQAMQQRRDEIVQAIQMANQAGQFKESIALQRELANLNAEIQRRGQDINKRLADNQLGYNYADLQQRANRDATLAALGIG